MGFLCFDGAHVDLAEWQLKLISYFLTHLHFSHSSAKKILYEQPNAANIINPCFVSHHVGKDALVTLIQKTI
jgi:hypothetical protein